MLGVKSFIEDRIRMLDLMEAEIGSYSQAAGRDDTSHDGSNTKDSRGTHNSRSSKGCSVNIATRRTSKQPATKCSFCHADHFVGYCDKFSACSQDQRRAHALSAKLCFNCLNIAHSVESCTVKGRCFVCGRQHHTKLHVDKAKGQSAPSPVVTAHAVNSPEVLNTSTYTSRSRRRLLSTACVTLQSPLGQSMTVRALLDSGAEESFLSEHVVRALSLTKNPVTVVVFGVGDTESVVACSRVDLTLKSERVSDFVLKFSALVVKRVSAFSPQAELKVDEWTHLKDLSLADPNIEKQGRVSCILNSEVYAEAFLPGLVKGPSGTSATLSTVFGWVLMGVTGQPGDAPSDYAATHLVAIDRVESHHQILGG